MNMSRFILLAGVAGLYAAGCSSPAEEGDIADPPALPPPGFANGMGQGGTGQQVGQAGTGGTGALPVGGAGGAPVASAGAGGSAVATAGAGGTMGAGGTSSTIPTGTGNLIMHDSMGWVAGASNGVGIQGSFYTISDATGTPPGVTTIALDDLTTPTSTCVSGTASAVPDDTGYSQFWGGGLALNLADPGGGMPAGAWNRGAVAGFSFTVSGPTIPPGLRFQASGGEAGPVYCSNIVAGPNNVQFGTLVTECYQAGGTPLPPTAGIQSIQWQVVTVLETPTPFDFCVDNLTALTSP
jgi:hypothetical protein